MDVYVNMMHDDQMGMDISDGRQSSKRSNDHFGYTHIAIALAKTVVGIQLYIHSTSHTRYAHEARFFCIHSSFTQNMALDIWPFK